MFQEIPSWPSVFHKWWARDNPAKWLADSLGITIEEAQAQIEELPIPVGKRLSWNARNPRAILGIAAFLNKADVIAYRTDGTDPSGASTIHQYVIDNLGEQCAIHIAIDRDGRNGTYANPKNCVKCKGLLAESTTSEAH